MRLHSLTLQQFRSYESLTLAFSESSVHLLVGPNGAGKTNVLEAISVLSLSRSCLGAEEGDLLQWEAEYYRVRGEVEDDAGERKSLEVVSQTAPRLAKACFINDVKTGVEGMVGVLPTVVFLPQDLQLFSGAPGLRRRFLDRLLCQVSPEYLQAFSQYQKILKQRNTLLKRISEGVAREDDLLIWDQQLAQMGAPITTARLELCGTLQLTLPEEVLALGEQWSEVELRYDRQGEQCEKSPTVEEELERLERYRRRDLALQSTTVGPHRDDWKLMANSRELSTFASRGQQRTALLALLLLQVSYLELRCGEKPLILLDDVFSELDDHHQKSLLDSLEGYQVLLTATRVPEGASNIAVWEVGEGEVVQRSDAVALV